MPRSSVATDCPLQEGSAFGHYLLPNAGKGKLRSPQNLSLEGPSQVLRPNYMPTSLGSKNDPTFRFTTASTVFCLILKYARGHSFILSHTRISHAHRLETAWRVCTRKQYFKAST